jgi:hypothetical protein
MKGGQTRPLALVVSPSVTCHGFLPSIVPIERVELPEWWNYLKACLRLVSLMAHAMGECWQGRPGTPLGTRVALAITLACTTKPPNLDESGKLEACVLAPRFLLKLESDP